MTSSATAAVTPSSSACSRATSTPRRRRSRQATWTLVASIRDRGPTGYGHASTHDTSAGAAAVAAALGVPLDDLFDLTVRDTGPAGTTEIFRNVTYRQAVPGRSTMSSLSSPSLVRWSPAAPPPAGHPDSHDDPTCRLAARGRVGVRRLLRAVSPTPAGDGAVLDARQLHGAGHTGRQARVSTPSTRRTCSISSASRRTLPAATSKTPSSAQRPPTASNAERCSSSIRRRPGTTVEGRGQTPPSADSSVRRSK